MFFLTKECLGVLGVTNFETDFFSPSIVRVFTLVLVDYDNTSIYYTSINILAVQL